MRPHMWRVNVTISETRKLQTHTRDKKIKIGGSVSLDPFN